MTRQDTHQLAHDVFQHERHPLDPFFSPRTVALVGASETEGSVGRTILSNLISSPFGGTVFPVNPRRSSVLGVPAYPSIKDVPAKIDLAIIATPALVVPGVVSRCAALGIPAAIISVAALL